MTRTSAAFILATLVLSACGGGGAKNAGNDTGGEARATASGFNALDACATLPKDKVEAISGLKVASAQLGAVTPPTDTTPGFSACTYTIAGGGTIGLYARQTPGGNTPELIALTRKALVDGMGAQVTDTSGIGTTAFTAQPMDQLHVFFDGDKYIYFMSNGVKTDTPMIDIARRLAAAVVG